MGSGYSGNFCGSWTVCLGGFFPLNLSQDISFPLSEQLCALFTCPLFCDKISDKCKLRKRRNLALSLSSVYHGEEIIAAWMCPGTVCAVRKQWEMGSVPTHWVQHPWILPPTFWENLWLSQILAEILLWHTQKCFHFHAKSSETSIARHISILAIKVI